MLELEEGFGWILKVVPTFRSEARASRGKVLAVIKRPAMLKPLMEHRI
jgi:hypothetical protein